MKDKIYKIGESSEDYLETILLLEADGKVRSVDIARHMEVSKPSVNKAMHVLKEKGYIRQETYGAVELTEEGRKVAQAVYERHSTIFSFFSDVLKVSPENAEKDACRVEHVISNETFERKKETLETYNKVHKQ